MKMKILIIGILTMTLFSVYLLIKKPPSLNIPKSYTDCLTKANTIGQSDKTSSDLVCSWTTYEDEAKKICKTLNIPDYVPYIEAGSQFSYTCKIKYYNENFKFPKNHAECSEKMNSHSEKPDCTVSISQVVSYNKKIAENLINECKRQNGTIDYKREHCTLIFKNQP